MKPTTNDQKIYQVDDRLKAEIDVYLTHEDKDAPSLTECRYAVLQLHSKGYVIYDRLLSRIVDGVYYDVPDMAMGVAQHYNFMGAPRDMAPNGSALGLKYPKKGRP